MIKSRFCIESDPGSGSGSNQIQAGDPFNGLIRYSAGISAISAYLLYGDLHAQVPSGHHDAICDFQDLVEVLKASRILNLGDNLDLKNTPDDGKIKVCGVTGDRRGECSRKYLGGYIWSHSLFPSFTHHLPNSNAHACRLPHPECGG